jgi:hypothetical protein
MELIKNSILSSLGSRLRNLGHYGSRFKILFFRLYTKHGDIGNDGSDNRDYYIREAQVHQKQKSNKEERHGVGLANVTKVDTNTDSG